MLADNVARVASEARKRIQQAREIVETGETRAMASDGPVGHWREELSNTEFDKMWHTIELADAILAGLIEGILKK